MLQVLSIAYWSSAKPSLSSCFREKNHAFKARFFINNLTRLIRIQRQVKFSSPAASGSIVAHENLHFAEERTQNLLIKKRNVEKECWKELQLFAAFTRLQSWKDWTAPTC